MTFVARFLFVSESEDYTDELFKDPYIQKHSKVAAVRKVFGPEEHFINFGYNFFKPGTLIPTFVWSPKKFMKSRDIIFTPNNDFQGFQFDVNIKVLPFTFTDPVFFMWGFCPGHITP